MAQIGGVRRITPGCIEIRCELKDPHDEQWFLLRSDVHHDNLLCDRAMEVRHLEECKKRGGMVIDNGDLFCLMQGKWDPRRDFKQIRPEHVGNDYFDLVTTTTLGDYAPYADLFAVIGAGNHEISVQGHHQTDMTERLVSGLRQQGSRVLKDGYSGFIKFRLNRMNQRGCFTMFRHHGYGHGAPVTKGTIQTARMAVYMPDAQVVLTGHDHNEWVVPIARTRITQHGRVYQDEQVHVRVPGYKRSPLTGSEWSIQRGMAPTPCGAAWLRIYMLRLNRNTHEFRFEVTRAQ